MFLGSVFMAATLLVAFFSSRWELPIPGQLPFYLWSCLMISAAKHAFYSLRWYARQDAETWKMLFFLWGVLFISAGIASIS
jgi:hypothetical protein